MQVIADILELMPVEGDVGIEIELEASGTLPSARSTPKGWRAEGDGSLRGTAMEYITRGAVPIDEVGAALENLKSGVTKNAKINHSFRAGVHVHLNVQSLSVTQMGHLIATYYCLEDAFVKFCGSSREGNHFCLRLRDAEYPLIVLCDALTGQNLHTLRTDEIRYSSLNLAALVRYGSLEFRGMETDPKFAKIENWCQMLHKLREYAINLPRREDIAFSISAEGPENWARGILGDELFSLINHDLFEASVLSCMRRAQQLIYLQEEEWRPKKPKTGRGTRAHWPEWESPMPTNVGTSDELEDD